ncbi:hypothetical protein D3C84_635410 [compost metagenome]
MRFDNTFEGVSFDDLRGQQLVGGELVDITQCPLQRHLVLADTQFRFAGEIANAMHEELDVLLKRRARRERCLVSALQAIQHQTATRCQHIAEQRHLRTAQAIENHVDATVAGVLVDLHEQVLFLGDDNLLGAQRKQVLALFGILGRGENLQAQRLAHLHEGRPRTVAGIGDQGCLPGLGPGQVDIGEIGHQQRRVMHAGFDRGEVFRVAGHGVARQHDDLAVHRVVVGAGSGKAGDLVTDLQVVDTLAYRADHARHFMTHAGWQACLGRRQVLAPERVVPADADRFNADLHLAGSRLRRGLLFDLEHLGRAKLVETDHAGHRKPRLVKL